MSGQNVAYVLGGLHFSTGLTVTRMEHERGGRYKPAPEIDG
jgi:hypothetical protein